jgi:predicted  nucleic acid-binding Zn-ribbon protein
MKEVEEMENKMIKLEQEKRAEEEALQNNVQKLRKKINILKNEIIDLKYDNEKDRIDFFENIKDLDKENKFYEGIIKYLLSDKRS